MRMIFENLLALLDRGEDAVLVTVASAQGSTPRGAGSQLLAGREGLMAGTIGGGPGEAQALAFAAELLREGRSAVRRLELRQLLPADPGLLAQVHLGLFHLFCHAFLLP